MQTKAMSYINTVILLPMHHSLRLLIDSEVEHQHKGTALQVQLPGMADKYLLERYHYQIK